MRRGLAAFAALAVSGAALGAVRSAQAGGARATETAARATAATSASASTPHQRLRVCLAPLGRFEKSMLPPVERGIEYLYQFEVRVLEPRPLPRSAYYRPRRRYRAEKILGYLDAEVVPGSGCDLVIGFTRADISTTKDDVTDWGILGLAWVGGPSGVVSTYRMGRHVTRRGKAMRAVKVVNHELGHALGLEHGGGVGCLMEDAGGTVKTVDRESGLLCDESRQTIEDLKGIELPVHRRFEWERVLD